MINWISENETWLSLVVAASGVVITAILTVIIIVVTIKNQKKTMILEKEISEQESIKQEQRLRVEAYTHKRDVFRSAIGVINLCSNYQALNEKLKFEERIDKVVIGAVEAIFNTYVPDTHEAIENLYEAQFVFSTELSEVLTIVGDEFDKMCGGLSQYRTFNTHFSSNGRSELMCPIKTEFLKNFEESCEIIMGQKKAIERAMKDEMSFG